MFIENRNKTDAPRGFELRGVFVIFVYQHHVVTFKNQIVWLLI